MSMSAGLLLADGFPRADSPFFDPNDPALAKYTDVAADYHRDGFVLIPDLLSADACAAIVDEVAELYRHDVDDGGRSRYRVQDGWCESQTVKSLASHPQVLDLLAVLYGRRPFPFQTLNFRTGSQQRNHSDSIHFSSLPRRFMCGVWVALEDTTSDNGPLFYVPGSHRLPELTLADMGMTLETASYARYEDVISEVVLAAGLDYQEVHVPKGTAFVWSANLIHGGMPIKADGQTRHSQVTHYFFDGCIHYTPLLSEVPTGELYVRVPTDISTGLPVEPSYNDQVVRVESTRGNLVRIRFESAENPLVDEAIIAANTVTGDLRNDAQSALATLLQIYGGRPDLQDAFGKADNLDLDALVAWAVSHGLANDSASLALRSNETGLRALSASQNQSSDAAVSDGGRLRRQLRRALTRA